MMLEAVSSFNILAILLGLLLLILYVSNKNKHVNLPPGPRGVPYFGNLLSVAKATHRSKLFNELGKEYGPVMTLWLGSRFAIVLNGYDVIKEALVDKADFFSFRPTLPMNLKANRDKGLLQTSEYKDRRRLALTSMRDFGLGKKSLEERMIEEAEMLGQELEAFNGKTLNLHNLMPVVTTNIICTIIRGDRFPYDSPEMCTIAAAFKGIADGSEFTKTENYVPWAKYIPFLNLPSGKEIAGHFNRVAAIVDGWIKEHKETFNDENIRDLIDLFILESRKEDRKCKEENILPIIIDLFAAGTETTSTTLLWCIAYLIVHKDVQTKCRKEIHEVIGRGKIPDFSASKKLPYLNGVINEIQRMANILPLSLLHATSSRVELRGYTIPKECIVIANLESALKDEKYWGDPYTFRPERWLDGDGQLLKKQALIPFSIGKRECLGELLAKKELFIFLSSMLQNFEFEMEDGTKPPDLAKGEGVVRSAPAYMARVNSV